MISGTAMQRVTAARSFKGLWNVIFASELSGSLTRLQVFQIPILEPLVNALVGRELKLTGTSCQQSDHSNQRTILHKGAEGAMWHERTRRRRREGLKEMAPRRQGKALALSHTLDERKGF